MWNNNPDFFTMMKIILEIHGLQNHAQQFDSAWHLDLLVISFSVINYVVSMSDPRVRRRRSFFLFVPNAKQVNHKIPASMNMAL